MITNMPFSNSLMRRLSRPEDEQISIMFESDYDFTSESYIVDYEAGSVYFPLEINTNEEKEEIVLNDSSTLKVFSEKQLTNLSEKYKISIEDFSSEFCLVKFKINMSLFKDKEFLWSNFMTDFSKMHSNDDIYDISDYIRDDQKIVNAFDCTVNVTFKVGDTWSTIELNLVEDKDLLNLSYFEIPEDVENNFDWLMTHPDLFTEIEEIKEFKIKISND